MAFRDPIQPLKYERMQDSGQISPRAAEEVESHLKMLHFQDTIEYWMPCLLMLWLSIVIFGALTCNRLTREALEG